MMRRKSKTATKISWKQGKFWRWFVISVVVFVFVIGFFLVLLTQTNSMSGQSYPTPSIRYIASLEDEIKTYREMLNGALDEQTRRSIEEKLAMAERVATEQAKGQPAPKNPDQTPELIPVKDPIFQPGIFEGQAGEFKPSQAKIQNRWQGIVNGDYVIVFAGSLGSDSEQGIIYVQQISSNKRSTTWTSYPTPERRGSVRIVQAEIFRLVLDTGNGNTFYFDVPAQRYLSSLTEIVSTITPISTPLPTTAPVTPYP